MTWTSDTWATLPVCHRSSRASVSGFIRFLCYCRSCSLQAIVHPYRGFNKVNWCSSDYIRVGL